MADHCAEAATDPPPKRSHGDRAAIWSAIIAAVALAAALVFNGIQVATSVTAQRESRLATELGLLTQINEEMNRAVYRRIPYADEFRDLSAGARPSLSPKAYRATAEEAATMEYAAWLFNAGHLTVDGAEALWGPRMECEYEQAFVPIMQNPAGSLPELFEYLRNNEHPSEC